MHLLSINPFMQIKWYRKILHIGFFMTTTLCYLEHTVAPSIKLILQVCISSDSPKEGIVVSSPELETINIPVAVYIISPEQTIPLVITIPSPEPKCLLLMKLRFQYESLNCTRTVQLYDRSKLLLASLQLKHLPPPKCVPLQKLLKFSSLFLLDGDRLKSNITARFMSSILNQTCKPFS